MAKSSTRKAPRKNPFWSYRDPSTGRWLTVMTSDQCQQLDLQVFVPRSHTAKSVKRQKAKCTSLENFSSRLA